MKKNTLVGLMLFLCFLATYGCTNAILQSSQKPHPLDIKVEPNTIGYFLPKGMIKLSSSQAAQGYQITTTLTIETKYIPDPEHFYTLNYMPNSGYEDDINIALDGNGMLQDINVTTEDKSPAIVEKVVETVKEVVKFVMTVMTFKEEPTPTVLPPIDIVFDPDIFLYLKNESKVKELKKTLSSYLDDIKLEPKALKVPTIEEPTPQEGIYYRLLLPYELTLIGNSAAGNFIKKEIIYLPNKSPILSLDIKRRPFIKKATRLMFTNGILTSVHITKPSEILGGLEIPFKIAKTLASMPTELIQFKIDYSSKQQALLEQLKREVEAERSLREGQLQLQQLKKEVEIEKKELETERFLRESQMQLLRLRSQLEEERRKRQK